MPTCAAGAPRTRPARPGSHPRGRGLGRPGELAPHTPQRGARSPADARDLGEPPAVTAQSQRGGAGGGEANGGPPAAPRPTRARRPPAAQPADVGRQRPPTAPPGGPVVRRRRWPPGGAEGRAGRRPRTRGPRRGKPGRALRGAQPRTPRGVARPKGPRHGRPQRQGRQPWACAKGPREHRGLGGLAWGRSTVWRPGSCPSLPETQGQPRSPVLAARFSEHRGTGREG